MAKKPTETKVRYRVTVGCGNKNFILNFGDILEAGDIPKEVNIDAFVEAGMLEVYTGDVASLSDKALLAEAKALKEENDALKAMG